MMIKRMLALLLALCLLLAAVPFAMAEETEEPELSEEEMQELLELDQIQEKDDDYEDNGRYEHIGPLYEEKSREDFNLNSPALYTARLMSNSSAHIDRDITSQKLIRSQSISLRHHRLVLKSCLQVSNCILIV